MKPQKNVIAPAFSFRRHLIAATGALMLAPHLVFAQTSTTGKKPALTPQDFGAVGDGVKDDTAAFAALAREATYIRVPQGRYLIRGTISILARQVWQFEGAEMVHTTAGAMFQANAVNDWAMLGVARFEGAGGAAQSPANVGLAISTCKRFRVSKLQFSKFSGVGLLMMGGSVYLNPRGDRGQFSDLGFTECARAIEIQAMASSEYNVFTNTEVTACGDGIVVAAGNCQFVGGNVVDCKVGVVLLSGLNHGHGGFHGFNINHSTQYNLVATSSQNGYTFTGCHFYGDGPANGAIYFSNSRGILIQGGQIDCTVINDGREGKNFILNNVIPGTNFKVISNTGDAANLICRQAMRYDGTDACK